MRKQHWGDPLCISGRIMVPIPIPVVLQMLQFAHLITGHLFALSVFFLINSLVSVRRKPWRWPINKIFESQRTPIRVASEISRMLRFLVKHMNKEIEIDIKDEFFHSNRRGVVKILDKERDCNEVGHVSFIHSRQDGDPPLLDLDSIPLTHQFELGKLRTESLFITFDYQRLKQCRYCTHTYSKQSLPTIHALTHFQCKFVCNQGECTQKYSERAKLASHLKFHHKMPASEAEKTAVTATLFKTSTESKKDIRTRLIHANAIKTPIYLQKIKKQKGKKPQPKLSYRNLNALIAIAVVFTCVFLFI